MRTDKPKPPPFPVGARVRYIGNRELSYGRVDTGEMITVLAPGIEVTISEARPGRQGTGRLLDPEDELYDETRDGCSVYWVDEKKEYGRVIFVGDKDEWQRLDGK